MTKEPNSCMEQSVTFRTLLVDLTLALDLQSCLLVSASLTLPDSDVTQCNSTVRNDDLPDVLFLSKGFLVIHINI